MSIDQIIQTIALPFVIRSLIVGIMISLSAALLGVILVLKRYSLIGHGLADVGFGAASLALALGISPLYISVPIVIIASFIIMAVSQNKGINGDVAIGVVSTGSLCFGVIITALTKGFNMDVLSYMFGSVLTAGNSDVFFSIALAAVVIGMFFLFYNRLFLITSDESFARASGINVTMYQFLISFLTAVTVVIGMRMMGTLLISSLIIFPTITARKLVNSFKSLVILSGCVSVFCFIVGIIISFAANLPIGASVVAVNIIMMIITHSFSLCKNMGN